MTGPTTTTQGEALEARIEQLAQFLHDEGGFGEAYSQRTWPEHPDDTGQRQGGFVKIVPSHAQAKFRDVARRWLSTPSRAALQPNIDHAVGGDLADTCPTCGRTKYDPDAIICSSAFHLSAPQQPIKLDAVREAWERLIADEAQLVAEDENEKEGHCGAYGTSTAAEYVNDVRAKFEKIGKAYAALATPPLDNTGLDAVREDHDFVCPACMCREFARLQTADLQETDDVRCVGCKRVYSLPLATPPLDNTGLDAATEVLGDGKMRAPPPDAPMSEVERQTAIALATGQLKTALAALATPSTDTGLDKAMREAVALIDEVNERVSARALNGINQHLHAKLCTIRATLARALASGDRS